MPLSSSSPPVTLEAWLAHCERLHPSTIDLTLERVQAVAQRLPLRFGGPVFTVAGTNGKGSTCAMLEAVLIAAGYRVGVYTSPHLVHFEERCRIDGQPVQAQDLLPHFEAVEQARQGAALTYFEFTTLAILSLLAARALDAVVLEVGLGGRLDAVNAVDTDCAIITSIDLDHMDFLGPDREAIGREKAGIMRPGRPVVVSDPVPPESVVRHAEAIGADLWRFGRDFNYAGQQSGTGTWQQWSWAGRQKRYTGLAYPALRGTNQLLNASGVLAALEAVRDRLPVTAQAVRNGLAVVELPGRFQIVPGQPTLVLDVAHNPHAVAALAQNLDQMGFFPRTHAVFGAMADKDTAAILRRMAPLVDAWHFTDLPTPRAAAAATLAAQWRELAPGLPAPAPQAGVSCHADPVEALRAALEEADPTDRILVFGSFYTVGGVLEQGLPRLAAKHVG
ncbi:bifunctional tetrahydrofolate synthase/dihydrofolate synthase [Caldimonas thermodepolymerans]|uniref:Dihydrofolate synthase/folylpolyglutamate synthase n=1 Tax=Caldimonas thermodepolymerans TaxID=215580 RepID=A0A2S5T1F6_9BURK|nr:bifunctional tetrahydrofolate synthase/dihydrofolate synthase [Caldimonas thermodepolymerans]PPE68855.1 bifunctional tetrahydrofolate synthase/dihydrofolate synthase [Caldimonas thermodepolymerans]QPC30446.1 bifunctional tetrahydrofolate synthase/dihydrofolate synthase [Caldimonas thermodepolymerans]RDI02972.1 dihydrofolate synthase/folylpolyglutamate synthase [Caldimonas thermodepolymerans]TCP08551.1 dihydrofolate synthase/folylpolyglutamate synthase [Caldimonas thermodepolymerans]UZG46880